MIPVMAATEEATGSLRTTVISHLSRTVSFLKRTTFSHLSRTPTYVGQHREKMENQV